MIGHLIFKKDLIIFDTFLPLLAVLGSFILVSNLFKISPIDLPAMIVDGSFFNKSKKILLSTSTTVGSISAFVSNRFNKSLK